MKFVQTASPHKRTIVIIVRDRMRYRKRVSNGEGARKNSVHVKNKNVERELVSWIWDIFE